MDCSLTEMDTGVGTAAAIEAMASTLLAFKGSFEIHALNHIRFAKVIKSLNLVNISTHVLHDCFSSRRYTFTNALKR